MFNVGPSVYQTLARQPKIYHFKHIFDTLEMFTVYKKFNVREYSRRS